MCGRYAASRSPDDLALEFEAGALPTVAVGAPVGVAGACTFHLDDGRECCSVLLDRPDRGLLLPPLVWREMDGFTPDCVLMLLADHAYDAGDYIRDREQFLRLAAARAA